MDLQRTMRATPTQPGRLRFENKPQRFITNFQHHSLGRNIKEVSGICCLKESKSVPPVNFRHHGRDGRAPLVSRWSGNFS